MLSFFFFLEFRLVGGGVYGGGLNQFKLHLWFQHTVSDANFALKNFENTPEFLRLSMTQFLHSL